jgi:formate/nitrite transporter FocA (FNT family)
MGVTTRELNKMLEQGQVLAEDMIPKLSRVLREELGASAVIAAQQTQASITRLSNAFFCAILVCLLVLIFLTRKTIRR